MAKRPTHQSLLLGAPHLYPGHPAIFDYQNGLPGHAESLHSQRDDRDLRTSGVEQSRAPRPSNDEDWRNIHSMLTCISGMVEKTKRAISILQQRGGIEPHPSVQDSATDIRRQTEEKIAEFRRSAEESVNQVCDLLFERNSNSL